MLAVVSLVASSCESKDQNPEPVKFEITSSDTFDIGAEGGVVVVTYTLGGGDYSLVDVATDNEAMITALNTEEQGIICAMVAANNVYEARTAQIRISFNGETKYVAIHQEGDADAPHNEVVNVTANQLVGNYYGDNLREGVGHYWIILTKDGFVDGAAVAGGEYFRLDLMAPMPEDMDNIRIPDGEYRFDLSLSGDEYTIVDIGNTDYSWVDENMEGWALALDDASLTVSGNRFELIAVVDDKEKEFHVSFDGDYSLTTSIISDCVSSLTGDAVIDVSNCTASVYSYGDYWECGYNNWCIEFVCNAGMKDGTYLVIDFLNNSTTDFTGRYEASGFSADDETKPDFRSNVFVPGFRVADDADLLLGSLYMVYKDGLCLSQAPLYGGTVTITANGDGTHTIVIDATDDAEPAHKITLNWTGELQ